VKPWNSNIPRRTPLKQRSRLRPFGRVRKRRQAKGDVYGPYHRFVGTLRSCIVGRSPAIYCFVSTVAGHHLKTVGAGGRDYGNEVPLCASHHSLLHRIGPSRFEQLYGLNLEAEAELVRQLWEGR
jgi:hypothetical protein